MASGTAFVALLAVAGSSFTAIAFVVSEGSSEFTLEPNTFRLDIGEVATYWPECAEREFGRAG